MTTLMFKIYSGNSKINIQIKPLFIVCAEMPTSCLRSSGERWYCQNIMALWDFGLHSRKVLLFSTPYTVLSKRVDCPFSSSTKKKDYIIEANQVKWGVLLYFYRYFVTVCNLYLSVSLRYVWQTHYSVSFHTTLNLEQDDVNIGGPMVSAAQTHWQV